MAFRGNNSSIGVKARRGAARFTCGYGYHRKRPSGVATPNAAPAAGFILNEDGGHILDEANNPIIQE